jgi:hypothetical protein
MNPRDDWIPRCPDGWVWGSCHQEDGGVLLLALERGSVSEGGVTAGRIVAAVDPVEDGSASELGAVGPLAAVEQLTLA